MQIRPLTPSDAPTYQALRLRGLRESPSAFSSSFEEECDRSIETVAERLTAKVDAAVFGAYVEEALVGVVGIKREASRKLAHKAYLWGMYLAPENRKMGAARQLVSAALAHASQALQVRQVLLGVNARNDSAIALYRALGFAEFGREPGFLCVDGELHDELHMVCVVDHTLRHSRGTS